MLVTLGSLKGSPGVTTLALAVAARWPLPWERVVVEADPGGGDLAARYQLALTPGLVSLAIAARRNTDPDLLITQAQRLPGGLPVVVGPPRGDQARAALSAICGADGRAGVLGAFAGRSDVVVIADCGRLGDDLAVAAVLREADKLLVVARPRADELAHVAEYADSLTSDDDGVPRVGLVLVGSGYPRGDVEREIGVPVLGEVPVAAHAAAMLSGQRPGRPRTRSPLIRATAGLAARLAEEITSPASKDSPQVFPATAASPGFGWSVGANGATSTNGHSDAPSGRA